MHTEITIQIDKAGRVVIPKEVRDEFALGPNDELTLTRENGHIILTPAQPKGLPEEKG